jgi:hypothetical protein
MVIQLLVLVLKVAVKWKCRFGIGHLFSLIDFI